MCSDKSKVIVYRDVPTTFWNYCILQKKFNILVFSCMTLTFVTIFDKYPYAIFQNGLNCLEKTYAQTSEF